MTWFFAFGHFKRLRQNSIRRLIRWLMSAWDKLIGHYLRGGSLRTRRMSCIRGKSYRYEPLHLRRCDLRISGI